jgi:hypothetical protein
MLESTDKLWRYMKLGTFLLLLDGKAWLPSIATLQSMDPLEGRLGDDFHENLWAELHRQGLRDETEEWLHKSLDPSMQRMLGLNPGHYHLTSRVLGNAYAEIVARRRVAWCWFKSDLESAGMWSIYGNRGIAVRTSPEQIDQSFPAGKERTIEKMIYVDRRSCADTSLQGLLHERPESILRPYFLKAAEYEHEGEVRLVAHCPEGAAGILVKDIKVENLINEIVISPLLPLDESEAIKQFLTDRAPHFKDKIKQSDLNGKNTPDMADRVDEVFYGTTDDHMYLAELPPALRKL